MVCVATWRFAIGISKLKYIEKLHCSDNCKIDNVNHLKNTLKILNCSYTCGIDQNGISELQYIEEIYCSNNNKINNVNHLKNTLKILHCSHICGIDQNGMRSNLALCARHFRFKIYRSVGLRP